MISVYLPPRYVAMVADLDTITVWSRDVLRGTRYLRSRPELRRRLRRELQAAWSLQLGVAVTVPAGLAAPVHATSVIAGLVIMRIEDSSEPAEAAVAQEPEAAE